ncbi:MAG TPA: 1-acyl-sn-glycerol-3-phosphate acyltransferase [Bacteroidales bacterium]|jgi:1-acyl-sn-glycerol-3-phosphate acyltransferase|nr:acyltransferase [Bacteroidales bacterium]HOB27151.1 1-acyl-sn-glycerol-3-phosphate acyltransferase [Bacteroidales bacterium]HOK21336.1 1-acyl-sn-glycerol-3-phosphate acyltransferase [Bacteroidales bacterium]HOL74297.1 1-acyl-sn-glycerol-3-phosphate acyltransferase [Bacteroidales bacterium]HPZ36091.1 1-acyl-sn-glycerol-3-phosphate acyltransferase [Bacteroidales bacterium]
MSLANLLLRIIGWRVITDEDISKYDKAVLIMSPHTSNNDFIIGWLALKKLNVKAKFLIKKELFVFPLSIILKSLGALPVDRKNPKNLPIELIKIINESSKMWLIITPEGTRKPVHHWKKGFYYIAQKADIPIIPSFLDYDKKEAHVLPAVYPTGDYDNDMLPFIEILKDVIPKNKGNFVLPKK